jgi:hypothetical protein
MMDCTDVQKKRINKKRKGGEREGKMQRSKWKRNYKERYKVTENGEF